MMNDSAFCYVAGDPEQPGTAWAATVDKPEYAKETASTVARWIAKGANVLRVDIDTARDMLSKWERPEKKQASLL